MYRLTTVLKYKLFIRESFIKNFKQIQDLSLVINNPGFSQNL
jgi:hypothetical protein